MATDPLLQMTSDGLFCPLGGFHIDPWEPVAHAVITHAHSDHARPGSKRYLTSKSGQQILQLRLGTDQDIHSLAYGEQLQLGSVHLSLHPAGHILGSSQVRIEHRGQVCVVSGDYKTTPSPTAEPFEVLRCHHFVSECTFGLPIYRWPHEQDVFTGIHNWWKAEQDRSRTCVLLVYALGKAQRVLAGLDPAIGPILGHGAVLRLLPAYRQQNITFPPIEYAGLEQAKANRGRALVLAPPSASGSTWIRKFGPVSLAMASGWMQVRGLRRRKGLDRGFVLSDHADWNGLNHAIQNTGADRVWLTHGSTATMTRWLREKGIDASTIPTRFEGEADEPTESDEPSDLLNTAISETTASTTPPASPEVP